ncbi:MAG: lysophospholipid acyltransferase family protein [Proteobacteria bacterium]|nr:lysophospholipid acyltransferase family protein [Pseudomonadota bacterium]MBU1685847.1 lysophospholipid acyltransferase family protein [Pseudomonadota bacterium]
MKRKPFYKRVRDDLFYLLTLLLIRVTRLLPRWAAFVITGFLGKLSYLFASSPRKRTLHHLQLAFGAEKSPAEIRDLARRVFIHFATAAGEILRLPNLLKNDLNAMVTVHGQEHLTEAAKQKRGIIFLSCHFGNWEIMAAWAGLNGYPLQVVGTPLFDPRLDRILIETREMTGNKNIARGTATREIIRSLQRGEAVAMLIDQDTKADGVFVEFFGRPAYTPIGPALLARKYGAPIIPVFMIIRPDRTYELEILPPIKLAQTDDADHDILVNTRKCSDIYETVIRRHPEQWAWMHKRWKTQPKK